MSTLEYTCVHRQLLLLLLLLILCYNYYDYYYYYTTDTSGCKGTPNALEFVGLKNGLSADGGPKTPPKAERAYGVEGSR